MEKEILSILKHFGWDESFHIPVANEKNKLLECRVKDFILKNLKRFKISTQKSIIINQVDLNTG